MQRKKLTPEDVAHIHETYREYIGHLGWGTRSLLIGALAGAGLAAAVGHVEASNPMLWLGAIYGAALSAVSLRGTGTPLVLNVVNAPVTFARDVSSRIRAVAAGRRALLERFKDREAV